MLLPRSSGCETFPSFNLLFTDSPSETDAVTKEKINSDVALSISFLRILLLKLRDVVVEVKYRVNPFQSPFYGFSF